MRSLYKNHKKWIINVLVGCLMPYVVYAADEVVITSEALTVYRATQQAIFTGAVRATQKDMVINCDKMIVFYDESARSTSDSMSEGKIKKIELVDNVELKTPNEHATSNKGEYDTNTEVLILYENVHLIQHKNILEGDILIYNRKTGKSMLKRAENADNNRVKAILIPEK